MNKKQERDWAMLFGKIEHTQSSISDTLNFQDLIKNTQDPNLLIQKLLGKNLIESINFYESFLKKPPQSKQIKHEAESIYLEMKKMACLDMALLSNIHSLFFSTSLSFYHDAVRQYAQDHIVITLEMIIKNQAKLLKSIHFPILFKSKDLLRRKMISSFENMLMEYTQKGEYQNALDALLTLHTPIEPFKRATDLYKKIEYATKNYRKGADYFLSVLKIRLFSPQHQTPGLIHYNSLKDDLFDKQDFQLTKPLNIDYETILFLKNEIMKVDKSLMEVGLKEQYANLIIPHVEILVNLAKENKDQ
jgi:tetratricopeptide (TPR) repeat protein